jgi:ABC-2 type transport system permease protein
VIYYFFSASCCARYSAIACFLISSSLAAAAFAASCCAIYSSTARFLISSSLSAAGAAGASGFFSVAAFSLPYESMYGAIGIFSWLLPARYNFLIYIDQALNGIDIYYSRFYFIAYIIFMLSPLTMLWKLKKAFNNPIYIP